MELKQFVKDAILEAYNGIEEARKGNENLNKAVNTNIDIKPVEFKIKVGLNPKGEVIEAGNTESASSLEFNLRLDLDRVK